MQKKFKKTLLIDLDGVLNEYQGNFDENLIPEPKNGAKEFLEKLNKDFELKLYTTRNKLLASKWLVENKLDSYFTDITNIKELAWLALDDRCLTFEGNFESTIKQIQNFKPWYKNNQ